MDGITRQQRLHAILRRPDLGDDDAAVGLPACRDAAHVGNTLPDAYWSRAGVAYAWWGGVDASGTPRGCGLMRRDDSRREGPATWVAANAGKSGWVGGVRQWLPSGRIYAGGLAPMRAAARSGFGRMYAPGGALPVAVGAFARNRLHGLAVTRDDLDGGLTLGYFRAGSLHGPASRTWSDGWRTVGHFVDGVCASTAHVRQPDGRRIRHGAVTETGRPLAAGPAVAAPPILLPAARWDDAITAPTAAPTAHRLGAAVAAAHASALAHRIGADLSLGGSAAPLSAVRGRRTALRVP